MTWEAAALVNLGGSLSQPSSLDWPPAPSAHLLGLNRSVTRAEDIIKATQGQAGSSSFLFVCLLSQPPDTFLVGEDGEELSPAPTPSVNTWDKPFSLLEIPGLLRE